MKKTTLSFFAVFIISIMNIYSGNYTPKAGDYVFTGATSNTWTTYTNWSVSDGAGGYTGTLTALGIANTSAGFCYIPEGKSVTGTGGSKGLWIDGTLTSGTSSFSVDGDLTVAGTLNLGGTCRFTNATITATGTMKYFDPSETTTSPGKIIAGFVATYDQKGNDLNYAYPHALLQNDGILKNVQIEIASNCQKLTIQGNPVETPIISGIRGGGTSSANVPFEIVVDQDMQIQKYSTKALSGANYYGGLISFATNSPTNTSIGDPTKISGDKIFTLNAGKKITFLDEYSGLGYRRDASPLKNYSSTYIGNLEKWTFNIKGIIDASLGFVNLCSTIDDTDLSNKLTLNNTGTIICGKWVREHSGQASGNYVVVNNLGSIKYTEAESYYTSNICAIGGARVGSYTYGTSSSEVTNSLITPYVATALRSAVNNKQYSYSLKNRVITLQHLVANDVVKVYNVNGQMIYSTRSMANSIDILMKNAGVYFVQITSGHKRENLKVTVM